MRIPVSVVTALLTMLCVPVGAQSPPGAQGHWEGTIDIPNQPLAISVDLLKTTAAWSGTISVPSQHIAALPLSDVIVKDDAVSFAMKGVPGDPQFKGKVSGEPRTLTGQFTQSGMEMPFTLAWKGEAKIEAAPKSTKCRRISKARGRGR
jgi:uncharacterized protein